MNPYMDQGKWIQEVMLKISGTSVLLLSIDGNRKKKHQLCGLKCIYWIRKLSKYDLHEFVLRNLFMVYNAIIYS